MCIERIQCAFLSAQHRKLNGQIKEEIKKNNYSTSFCLKTKEILRSSAKNCEFLIDDAAKRFYAARGRIRFDATFTTIRKYKTKRNEAKQQQRQMNRSLFAEITCN